MMHVRNVLLYTAACALLMACSVDSMAIEEPAYDVVGSGDGYELRRYAPYLVAETEVEGSLSSSGRKAFRILADYIFGNNSASQKMAMTAPVESTPAEGVKMAMTAPVESRAVESVPNRFVYGFVMEDKYTLETLPAPNNAAIRIRKVEGRTVAVHRFSGRWTPAKYNKHEQLLLEALTRDGIRPTGTTMLARFNGPMTPWFMRRNEVQVPVAVESDVSPASSETAHTLP